MVVRHTQGCQPPLHKNRWLPILDQLPRLVRPLRDVSILWKEVKQEMIEDYQEVMMAFYLAHREAIKVLRMWRCSNYKKDCMGGCADWYRRPVRFIKWIERHRCLNNFPEVLLRGKLKSSDGTHTLRQPWAHMVRITLQVCKKMPRVQELEVFTMMQIHGGIQTKQTV